MKPRDLAIYAFLAVTWGFSFMLLLRVVRVFGWAASVCLRSFVAALTLVLLAKLARRRLDYSIGWFPFAVIGATSVVAQLSGLALGTPRIGTAMTAILIATIPMFSMLISQIWGIERMRPDGILGLAAGLVGLVLLVGFPKVAITPDFLFGCAATLFGTFWAAFGSNYASHKLKGVGAFEISSASFFFGGVMMLPLLFFVPFEQQPGLPDMLYLVMIGALMSALTYVLYFQLVASVGPTKAISVEFAVTAVAVLVGAAMLDERLSLVQLLGTGFISLGCALVLGLVPGFRRTASP